MHLHTATLSVRTRGKGTYEVTSEVAAVVRESKVRVGLVTIFIQHTSASLILYENADRSARVDLESYFNRLVPEDADYFVHTAEGPDDMPGHIRMVLTRSSETIPIDGGQMQLGTWQGIFLFEHRQKPHHRTLAVTVIGQM